MTEHPESSAPGDEQAERLARLRARRDDLPAPEPSESATNIRVTPVEPVADGASRSARRRGPATTAKIVTVGASTTALLGMMAGYGIAGRAAASDTAETQIAAAVDPPSPTIPPGGTPAAAEPARVVVVVIDATSGAPISDVDAAILDEAGLGGTIDQLLDGANRLRPTSSTAPPPKVELPASAEASPVSTVPAVVAPTRVDLAVPEPPRPAPAPAAAPAAAPAPAPQAETSGS